jgi:2-C-methyl-D-erythritol 4-phosphate cytidylyltransferase
MTSIPLKTKQKPKIWALIPCAGSGSRAATTVPKQYHSLWGQKVVEHTLQAFAQLKQLDGLLLVTSPGDEYQMPASFPAHFQVVQKGGQTRAETVLNGLSFLKELGLAENNWVMVHDAARCLITPQQINDLIEVCLHDEVGGLLATPVVDTMKESIPLDPNTQTSKVAKTLTREAKWLAQTPQMFPLGLLQQALLKAGSLVTDESSAIEYLGLNPVLVASSSHNFKLTYPQDFALAEALLAWRESDKNKSTKKEN